MKEIQLSDQLSIVNEQQIQLCYNDFTKGTMVIEKDRTVKCFDKEIEQKKTWTMDIQEQSKVVYYAFLTKNSGDTMLRFQLHKDAALDLVILDFSTANNLQEITVELLEKGASVQVSFASLTLEKVRKKIHFHIHHAVQNTYSNIDARGIAKDASSLCIEADTKIVQGAKQSKAKQTIKTIVFDANAHSEANPILRIEENDVEASHAASEGQVNPDHVYYLMTRGLSEVEAKRLLTLSYIEPIIQQVKNPEWQEQMRDFVMKKV